MNPTDESKLGDNIGDEKKLNTDGDFVVPHGDNLDVADTTVVDSPSANNVSADSDVAAPETVGSDAPVSDGSTSDTATNDDGNTLKISHSDNSENDNTEQTSESETDTESIDSATSSNNETSDATTIESTLESNVESATSIQAEPAPTTEPTSPSDVNAQANPNPTSPTNPFAPTSSETPTLRPNNPFTQQNSSGSGTTASTPSEPASTTPPTTPNATPPNTAPVNPFAPKAGETPPMNTTPAANTAQKPFTSPFAQRPQFSAPQGDIVLATDQPPKKSKKPLAVVAILISVLVIISVAVAGVLSLQKQSTLASVSQPFIHYANYLLYNNENDTFEYNAQKAKNTYYVSQMLNTQKTDDKKNFFNAAEQKLNNATNTYLASNAQQEDITRQFTEYRDHFDFIHQYALAKPIDETQIYQSYAAGKNHSQMEAQIKSTYQPFIDSSSQAAQQYGENAKKAATIANDLVDAYYKNGCIRDQAIDTNCTAAVASTVASPAYTQPDTLVEQSLFFIIEHCPTIINALGGQGA